MVQMKQQATMKWRRNGTSQKVSLIDWIVPVPAVLTVLIVLIVLLTILVSNHDGIEKIATFATAYTPTTTGSSVSLQQQQQRHRSLLSLLRTTIVLSLHRRRTTTKSTNDIFISTQTQTTTSVILYHKPMNVVTTHATDDILGRLNVYQDIIQRRNAVTTTSTTTTGSNPPPPSTPLLSLQLPFNFPLGWHSIGRLDAATSGLLLITNDGQLVHHVTNHRAASNHHHHFDLDKNTKNSSSTFIIQKTYHVHVMGYHTENCTMFDQFRKGGIDIGNHQVTLPVEHIHVLDHPTATTTLISMSIIEGRNRQIRRMFHACGSGVMKLTRTAIGSSSSSSSNRLTIDLVPTPGDWYILPDTMISSMLGWKSRSIDTIIPSTNNNNIKSRTRTTDKTSKSTTKNQTPRRRSKSHHR